MSSSSLNLYLTKMAQGDMTVANSACRKLANRFIAVPATERQEEHSVIVSALTLTDGNKRQIPVFTSEILLKEWCTTQSLENNHIKLLGADFCAALSPDYYLLVDPGSGHQVLLNPELVDEIACTPSDLNPTVEVLGPTVRAEVVEPVRSQPRSETEIVPVEPIITAEEESLVSLETTQTPEFNAMFDAPLGALPVPDSQLEFTGEEPTHHIQDAFDEDFILDDTEFPDVLTADRAPETEIIETEVEVSPQVSLPLQGNESNQEPMKKFSANFSQSNDPSATQFVKPIHRKVGAESLSDRFMFSKKEKSKEG